MFLLVDGDYLLSGFKPTSEAEVKAAVERMQRAIEEQLLSKHTGSPQPQATHIETRVVLFSSALLNSLSDEHRHFIISTLRRLRFQTTVLESVRGRAGSPIDAALCTKAIMFAMMPGSHDGAGGGGVGGVTSDAGNRGRASFCFVTPNAYIASALDLITMKGCDAVFAVYDGDEVAEELLGYISSSYGGGGGIAVMPKGDGVAFIPNTEAASAALAALQQEGKDLPLNVLMQLKHMQDELTTGSKISRASRITANGGGSGDAQATIIEESRRRRQEEQEMFAPPPPLPGVPNPFDTAGNGEAAGGDMLSATNGGPQSVPSTSPRDPFRLQDESDEINDLMSSLQGNGSRNQPPGKPPQQGPPGLPPPPPSSGGVFNGPKMVVSTASSPPTVTRNAVPPNGPPPPASPALAEAIASSGGEEPAVSTELPIGWALVFDTGRNRHYYAHRDEEDRTLSTWQHPLGPEKQSALDEEIVAWHKERQRQKAQQQQQRPPPTPTAAAAALPADWEERIDPRSGRKFYVNHATRETSWDPPMGTPAGASPSAPNPSSRQTVATGMPRDELPANWEMRMDPRSNRPYYVNHVTRETTWTRPRPPAAAPPAPPQPQPQPAQMDPWEARVDQRSGRTFFVNHETRETTWTKPERAPTLPPANPMPAASPAAGQWESRVDPRTGRTYYVNHATKQTSWVIPTS